MTDKRAFFLQKLSDNTKQTTRFIILAVALLLSAILFFNIVIGIGIFVYFRSVQAPVDTIKVQLKAINEGRIEDAYTKYTAEQFKKTTSLKNFTSLVESNPQIFKSKSSKFNKAEFRDSRAVVKGTITGMDGTITPITYTLVCEKNQWLILGFRQGSK